MIAFILVNVLVQSLVVKYSKFLTLLNFVSFFYAFRRERVSITTAIRFINSTQDRLSAMGPSTIRTPLLPELLMIPSHWLGISHSTRTCSLKTVDDFCSHAFEELNNRRTLLRPTNLDLSYIIWRIVQHKCIGSINLKANLKVLDATFGHYQMILL